MTSNLWFTPTKWKVVVEFGDGRDAVTKEFRWRFSATQHAAKVRENITDLALRGIDGLEVRVRVEKQWARVGSR